MKEPEYLERVAKGPVGFLHVWPRMRPFPLCVGSTFLVMLLLSATVAYLATLTALAPGAEFLTVLRFVGTAAFLGYAFGGLPDAIWFGKSPKFIALAIFDAFVYAVLTGAAFGLLWPGALDAAPGVGVLPPAARPRARQPGRGASNQHQSVFPDVHGHDGTPGEHAPSPERELPDLFGRGAGAGAAGKL